MPEPRDELGKKLSSYMTPQQIGKLIDEVLAIEKRTSVAFNCKKCGAQQLQYGQVSDARSVATALSDLMNQAFGRPSESSETVEPVIFKRLTRLEAEPDG